MNKRGRLKNRERVSPKLKSQSFQTISFLSATCPLSRPAGEGR
ncbi:hypothetical protein HMPREF3156_02809, partial [Neisseria sp. HMSC06F02]